MIVKELITILEKWPDDKEIIVWVEDEVISDFVNPIVKVSGIETNILDIDVSGKVCIQI